MTSAKADEIPNPAPRGDHDDAGDLADQLEVHRGEP